MSLRLQQMLVALVGAALCIFMVFLGLWQMQVFESQKSDTTAVRAAAPAVDLETNLYQGKVGDLYGRRVIVRGTWLDSPDELVGTKYPLRVVSPFRTVNGRTLAVVRGTVTEGQKASDAPVGVQEISGIILPSEEDVPASVKNPLPTTVRPALQLQELVQVWPAPMLDGYITLTVDQSARQGLGEATVKVPDTQGGRVRNQGYAMQWWAFAAFGAVATVVGVRSMGRPQKKHRKAA